MITSRICFALGLLLTTHELNKSQLVDMRVSIIDRYGFGTPHSTMVAASK